MRTNIDKKKSYYSNLKATERIRNEFVHNKSRDFFEWKKKDKSEPDFNSEEESYQDTAIIRVRIKTLKEDLKNAKQAIAAIRDIALFFDNADKSCSALRMLFSSFLSFCHETDPNGIELKKEFNIKVNNEIQV